MPAEQPTVLLLPGLLCDASVWPAQQAALQALAPVHVADYGDCSTIAAMAERALHDAPAGPLAVVGHSMGGRVALEIWRRGAGGGAEPPAWRKLGERLQNPKKPNNS